MTSQTKFEDVRGLDTIRYGTRSSADADNPTRRVYRSVKLTYINMVPLYMLGIVSYYSAIVTLSVRCSVFEIFDVKNAVTLKMG